MSGDDDDCNHEGSWSCECECEHWCWHSYEWECRAYECDCESAQGSDVSGSAEDSGAEFGLKDAAVLAGLGGLAFGALKLFGRRGKGTDDEETADTASEAVVEETRAVPPAGWYADGPDGGPARWWDGAKWTEHRRVTSTTPAGWYDDRAGSLRWWDGFAWTEHVAPRRP